jgi:cell division transport system ATP-binding protein
MIKVIEFFNVSKSFKNKYRVLSNVSFECMSGNTYFLYGQSCAGKTTIFKLLLKDINPNEGSIKICGEDIAEFNKNQLLLYRQQLGVIWQGLFLLDQKTVFENVALPLVLRGEDNAIILTKVNRLLEEVDLLSEKDNFPRNLTLGQRQIIAILRAIITNPKIILADEPMNHIDTNKEKIMWDLINRHKDPNAVILFTTSQKYIIDNFEGNLLDIHNGNVVVK